MPLIKFKSNLDTPAKAAPSPRRAVAGDYRTAGCAWSLDGLPRAKKVITLTLGID
jgi:hypothetical protein